jgi:hypothetical protein
MTTTTTVIAADPHASSLDDDEGARLFGLRHAMCAWRMDRVGGRARLVKDVAREHGASERELWRAYRRVCADLSHDACDYQDLDDYVAAWRDALVRALRGPRAMAGYWLGEMFERRIKEARLLTRLNGAKTHPKARALRAWRRNAEGMVRKWQRAY